jgi:hypothetical protein
MCPLSGVVVKGRKIVPHIADTVRVCFRPKSGRRSLFVCCPVHNVQMFLNDQSIVEEILHVALEEESLPTGSRDLRPHP